MPKKLSGSKSKTLDMSTIQTVDEMGVVVADAMTAIGKDVAADTRVLDFDAAAAKPLFVQAIDIPLIDATIERRVFTPFKGRANAASIGKTDAPYKWHVTSHWKIMGILNGIASMRLGHYALVEEGVHLLHSVKDLDSGMLYEGRFGYVDFSKASSDWVKFFEGRGVKHDSDKKGWVCVKIGEDGDLFNGFYIPRKEKLEEVAARLGKTIETLSPVTIANWQESRATQNKRRGVEAVLRVARGQLKIVTALKLENEHRNWQVALEDRRGRALAGSLEDLAKEMMPKGDDQLTADQDAFVIKQAPSVADMVVKTSGSTVVAYDGKSYSPEQLVKSRVIKMTGDMETGAQIYLRDALMVVRQFSLAAQAGMTLKVVFSPA